MREATFTERSRLMVLMVSGLRNYIAVHGLKFEIGNEKFRRDEHRSRLFINRQVTVHGYRFTVNG